MARIDQTIASLEERLKQAKARKQQAEARSREAAKAKDRRLDSRKKILIGAAVLAKVKAGEMTESELTDILEKFLTRPIERAVFNLPKKGE